jgi:uncharacterized membrane protein YphA (DoxX/SURF4 family)
MGMAGQSNGIAKLLTWPAALFIAGIFLWYEQYKLPGHPGSVHLFTILSDWLGIPAHEKPFRLFVAIAEIIASLLVLVPRTRLLGALGALALMSGAIFFHTVSPLGIDPYGDGGQLFKEACAVWLCAAYVVWAYRAEAASLVQGLREGRLVLA